MHVLLGPMGQGNEDGEWTWWRSGPLVYWGRYLGRCEENYYRIRNSYQPIAVNAVRIIGIRWTVISKKTILELEWRNSL